MTIKFNKPPINELIVAVYLNPPLAGLRAEHVGVFWDRHRDRFATIEQQAVIGPDITFGNEIYPTPRFWLTSKDETTVLQVQKTALMLNWRKREARYPHFEAVKGQFDECFELFSEFLKQEIELSEVKIGVAELTYVNVIEESELWPGPEATSAIIPSFAPIKFAEGKRADFNYTSNVKLDNETILSVTLRSARDTPSQDHTALVLEIKALARLQDGTKSEADKWFRAAHESIGEQFVRLTSDSARKYWDQVEPQ